MPHRRTTARGLGSTVRRLFVVGWFFIGNANWQVQRKAILAASGEPSFLATNFQITDFELSIQYRSVESTYSGIYLRTNADPIDERRDCYKLCIAPKTDEYPTGSLAKRKKVDPKFTANYTVDGWHTYRVNRRWQPRASLAGRCAGPRLHR